MECNDELIPDPEDVTWRYRSRGQHLASGYDRECVIAELVERRTGPAAEIAFEAREGLEIEAREGLEIEAREGLELEIQRVTASAEPGELGGDLLFLRRPLALEPHSFLARRLPLRPVPGFVETSAGPAGVASTFLQ